MSARIVAPFLVSALADESAVIEDPYLPMHLESEATRALIAGARARHDLEVLEDDTWSHTSFDERRRMHVIDVWFAPQPDRADGCVIEGGPHDGYQFAMSRLEGVGHPVHRLTLPILPPYGADLELMKLLGGPGYAFFSPEHEPATTVFAQTDYHCLGIDPATTRWVYVPGTCSTFP